MKSRIITASAVVAVLILAVWWMFFFSPVRSDADKVDEEIEVAQSENRALETEQKSLEDLQAREPEINAQRDRLRSAVPETPELATFIEQVNQIGAETGVTWVSVSPSEPVPGLGSGEVALTMQVDGGYFPVLDFLNRLENMPRLLVVDQLSLASATGADGSAQTLSASLTARMFTQSASPNAETTTPTSVAGGGGVAAPQTGTES